MTPKQTLPRGITLDQNGKFIAWGFKDKKKHWLGSYLTLVQAIEARGAFLDKKEREKIASGSLPSYLPRFKTYLLKNDLSEMTIEIYLAYFSKLATFLGPKLKVSEVNDIHARNFLESERKKGTSPYTIKQYTLRFSKRIFSWLVQEKQCLLNPFSLVKVPNAEAPEQSFFTQDEIRAVIDFINAKRAKAISPALKAKYEYHAALIRFLFASMIRKQELLKLRKDEIDWPGRKVKILGKREGHTVIDLTLQAHDALKVLCAYSTNSPFVIAGTTYRSRASGLNRIFGRLTDNLRTHKVIDLSDRFFNCYSLRHSMAMHLVDKQKMPIEQVSRIMRHSNIKTTMHYYHLSPKNKARLVENAVSI